MATTQFVLVFRRPVQLDGYTFPAGAIVPKGALTEGKLRSLIDGNWIEERREDELGEVPVPHRPPTVDPRLLTEAREHAAVKRREYEAAKRHLRSLEELAAREPEPPSDEPERAGVTLDDHAKPAPEPTPEPEQTSPPTVPDDADADGDADPDENLDGAPALPDHLK